jgi:hypothetical protein
LRVNFTAAFRTTASREALDPALLQRRLLLCLFGIGTNVGLKRVASQQPSVMGSKMRFSIPQASSGILAARKSPDKPASCTVHS